MYLKRVSLNKNLWCWICFLTRTTHRRTRPSKGRSGRPRNQEPRQEPLGEGGPAEAAAFIAESAAHLAVLARLHQLDLLGFVLAMVQLEAEEQAQLLGTRKPTS